MNSCLILVCILLCFLSLSQSFQPSIPRSTLKSLPNLSLKPSPVSSLSTHSSSFAPASRFQIYQSLSSDLPSTSTSTSNSTQFVPVQSITDILPHETQTSYTLLSLLSITVGVITGYIVGPFKASINTLTTFCFNKYGEKAPLVASAVLALFFLFDSRLSSTFHIMLSKKILKFYTADSKVDSDFSQSRKNLLTHLSYYFLFALRIFAIYLSIGLTGFLGSAGPSGEIVTTIGLFLYLLLAHCKFLKLHAETMRNVMLSSFAAGIATNFNAPFASIAFAFHVTMPTINSSNPASPFSKEQELEQFNAYNQPFRAEGQEVTPAEGKEYKFERIFKERFLQLFLAVLSSTFVARGFTFTLRNCKPGIQIPCPSQRFFPALSEIPLFFVAGALSTFLYRHHLSFRGFITDRFLSPIEKKFKSWSTPASSSSSSPSSAPSSFNVKFWRPLLVGLLGAYYFMVKNPQPVMYGMGFLNQHGKMSDFYKEASLPRLVSYFVSRFYANAIAVLSSNPGGLISPSIFMGSTFFMGLAKAIGDTTGLQLTTATLRAGMILTGMGLVSLNFKSKWLASFIICEMTMSKNWFPRVFFTTSVSFWLNEMLERQKREREATQKAL